MITEEKVRQRNRANYWENRDSLLEWHRDYYQRNKERICDRMRTYNRLRSGRVVTAEEKKRVCQYSKKYYWNHHDLVLSRVGASYRAHSECIRKRKQEVKEETLARYGNGHVACVRCNESNPACLTIDHIGGGGNAERRSGSSFYNWLKKHNYPDGYQTLCMNCQFLKRYENKEWRQIEKKELPLDEDVARNHALETLRASHRKLKKEVLTHYGGGVLACVKCGGNKLDFLSLDHINGKGTEERRRLKMGAHQLYYLLRRKGFPSGYQTLCMNDQWIKRVENREYRVF